MLGWMMGWMVGWKLGRMLGWMRGWMVGSGEAVDIGKTSTDGACPVLDGAAAGSLVRRGSFLL
jgi:hypothetical protein